MSVQVVDVGLGNISSVITGFRGVGTSACVIRYPHELEPTSRIVLPGVGSFGAAMKSLESAGWSEALRQLASAGRPILGICLGMQLLATYGYEGGRSSGLGLIPGSVKRLDALGSGERVPHVGWNEVSLTRRDYVFDGIADGTDFYFSHSFAFAADDPEWVIAHVTHGVHLTAAVRRNNVWGLQFHPEKSSRSGLRVLRNFASGFVC